MKWKANTHNYKKYLHAAQEVPAGFRSHETQGHEVPSAEWIKSSQTPIGWHLNNTSPILFTNPIKIISTIYLLLKTFMSMATDNDVGAQ